MTRLLSTPHPLHVHLDAFDRPTRFVWNNLHYRIQEIRQHWQVDSDWWHESGRVQRDYYAVTTHEGLFCVLYYDSLDQRWYLNKLYD